MSEDRGKERSAAQEGEVFGSGALKKRKMTRNGTAAEDSCNPKATADVVFSLDDSGSVTGTAGAWEAS